MTEGLELIELPPAHVDDLSEFTDEAKQMYELAGDGYRLKASAKEAIEQTNDEMKRLWAEYETGLAERDGKLAAKDAEIRRLAIKRDIANALARCGVKTSYFRAAATLLEQHLDIEVQENDDGSVTTSASGPFGCCTVEQSVASWLDSDEGVAFRPKQPTTGVGELQAAVRRLRRLH